MLYDLIFFLLFFLTSQNNENERLIFVATNFRHGARQPSLKNNKLKDKFGEEWDFPKELTGVGKRAHYILGLRNRIKYINERKFLSEKYNVKELEVYSSFSNRTIMSLIAHLQGLYPQSEKLGDVLNEKQLKNSNPPFNLNYSRINEEYDLLKNYALPDCMTVIPFQTIDQDKGVNIYRVSECGVSKTGDSKGTNESFALTDEFNNKYSQYFNKFYEKNSSYEYSFSDISDYCADYMVAYLDGRDMTSFRNTGINLDDLYNYCLEAYKISKRDSYLAVNDTLFLQGSKLMELFVNSMKMKIDMDINNVSESDSYYTPKMLIISGHDHTLCVQELFIILAFGLDINTFRFPFFAAQITFEVTTNNDNNKNKKNYSDYYVSYYFNDDLIFKITAEEFFKKVEPNIWPQEKIDNLCLENTKSKDSENDETTESIANGDDNINNNNKTNSNKNSTNPLNRYIFKSKDSNKGVKTALIIISCLFGISLIANIILAASLTKKNINTIPQTSLSPVDSPV